MELDDDFRLTEHCPKLAAMLLRGGSSTQGAALIYHGGSFWFWWWWGWLSFVAQDVSFCLIKYFLLFDACSSMAWQQGELFFARKTSAWMVVVFVVCNGRPF